MTHRIEHREKVGLLEPFPPGLPSSQSAFKLVAGQEGGIPGVVAHTIGRAALMAPALYLAGFRKNGQWWKGAIAGAMAIEVYVLGYTAWQYNSQRKKDATKAPVLAAAPTSEGVRVGRVRIGRVR
jgi:hypothetical protein